MSDRLLIAFVSVLVFFIACVSGDYETRGSDSLSESVGERTPQERSDCVTHNCMKRTINSAPGAMWFGPRLGRRRRSGQKALNFRQIEAVSEDKETAKFTPRLGRELAEEILFGDFEDFPEQIDRQDFYDEIRPKPMWIFRKGRENPVPFLPIPRLG
ncbi:PBAN-type neuropeptides-like [Leptopilina boulardi]|uniref:PBAN-type neuropeptides-like n=1 Tax=Leptopilina boulardi TaxID=63433 RepID=UPI0021F52B3A|nr:PBAN-type neuropeptides-like [Leptopilina boulardi]